MKRRYPCIVCKKKFADKSSMKEHVRSTHLRHVALCNVCGRRMFHDKLVKHEEDFHRQNSWLKLHSSIYHHVFIISDKYFRYGCQYLTEERPWLPIKFVGQCEGPEYWPNAWARFWDTQVPAEPALSPLDQPANHPGQEWGADPGPPTCGVCHNREDGSACLHWQVIIYC